MIKTDILIIGAGPTGLFTVFEAGLLKLKCHLIDALAQPGGQCSEIYPKKPIYDIPGFPEILAGDLTKNLLEQGKQFEPGFTLGERAETIEKLEDGSFIVTTNKGTKHHAPVVAIAGGLGSFEPRKPIIENLEFFEDKGVEYMIKDPEVYRDKKVVISGGGDSALDWSIFLANIASEVTLVHRRNEFRGALDSVEKVKELANSTKVDVPQKEGDHIGPVVSEVQFNKIQTLIQKGIDEGAKLVAGGTGKPKGLEKGYYVKPTVFADVNNQMEIARTEIFGPVLSIIPFENENEAISIANDTPYGLTNYIQTQDKEKVKRVARKLRSGMVDVNGVGIAVSSPFGGYKHSGIGREAGTEGLIEFLEVKTVGGWN